MKRFFFSTLIFLLIAFFAGGAWYLSKYKNSSHSFKAPVKEALFLKLAGKAQKAKVFAIKNGYNASYCFMVDMSLESGGNRFFVYNLEKDSVMESGLVTHGRCNENWLSGRKYGNEVGCGCTSLGKYKIGASYKGKFGLAYKLHGLDSTNSNAYQRFVVLHSHSCVPTQEVNPAPICQSDGCPTVAPAFLAHLAALLDKSDKPVLLWMFE